MSDSSSALAPPGSAEDRWRATLDALDVAIGRQRSALDAGEHVNAAAITALGFAPPDDLPPLPPALEERAGRLLAETSALIEQAQAIADRLQPAGPIGHQPRDRRVAPTFDRRM